jgi:hypothetical protein
MCMCTCACAWACACGFVCGTGFHRTRYVRACVCVHACPYAHGISRTVVQWTAIRYECLRRATITHRASASGSRRVYFQHAACDKHSVHHAAQCKVQHHIRQHATCPTQHATHKLLHAAKSTQHLGTLRKANRRGASGNERLLQGSKYPTG